MTTPSAMQPTSRASSADELKALLNELSNDIGEARGRCSGDYLGPSVRKIIELVEQLAIVPQVVQATIAYVNSDDLDNMLDDRTAEIQSNKSGWRGTPLYAAPIVATGDLSTTVPSEPMYQIGGHLGGVWYDVGVEVWDRSKEKRRIVYSAPSPTEQASDVRNLDMEKLCAAIMLEVEGNIRPTIRDCVNGADDVQDIYAYCDTIESIIESALKSASAAKGNAPAEAKS